MMTRWRIPWLSLLIVLILALESVSQENSVSTPNDFPILTGSYLGLKPPGMRPELFAPGIISTDLHDDFFPAFTPDGQEVFFRCLGSGEMIILHMKLLSGRWSYPEIASFSGQYNDLGALISLDGSRLFFSSDRPTGEHDTTGDLDIFTVDRLEGGWGVPYSVVREKNQPGDWLACSIDSAGTIYFFAKDSDGVGGYDLYRVSPNDGGYSTPILLDSPVNTRYDETSPCIAHDGSFLVYFSNRGPTGREKAGLFVTFLAQDDSWTDPVNLSKHLGMDLPAKFPGLSPDGKYLFMVVPESKQENERLGRRWDIDAFRTATPRYGGGNVYWVDAAVIEALRPEGKN
jgi:Tol biopolymer transport system component